MFDEKTILTRLQNGEDAQTIANEMAAMINAANKTYTDQKAAEEAAKAAAAKAAVQKKEELQDILDSFMLWLSEYYGVEEEVTADQVIELIDSIQEYVKAMTELGSMFHAKKPAAPVGARAIKQPIKSKSADDTLNDFLKQMGW